MAGGRKRLCGLAAAAVYLSLAVPAGAQEALPEDNSSVDQYSESLPSSEGDRVAGVDRRPAGRRLSASARRRLPSGAAGELQRRVATDPSLGAPGGSADGDGGGSEDGSGASGGGARGAGPGDERPAGIEKVDDPSLAATVGDAVFGSGLWPLLVAMAAVLGAGLVAARRRRDGQPRGP